MASNSSFTSPGRPLFPQVDDTTTQERLQRYAENWQFYLGEHQSFLKDTGEPIVIMNYIRRIVDIIVNFSFRKGFDLKVIEDERTSDVDGKGKEKDDRLFIKRFLDDEWDKNSRFLWLIEAGQMGGVTGDTFIYTSWDSTNSRYPDGYVRNTILPSHFCFPIYGGKSGRDRNRMTNMLILWPMLEVIDGESTEIWMAEEWTDFLKITYRDGQEITREENTLGEIPVTHVRNYPVAGQSFGLSDVNDVISLNKELNEKATDISEIIFYHGSPITYLIGATVEQLQRGANRVWGLPSDAQIGNLEISGDLTAAKSYMTELKETIKELAGVPENAFGKSMPMGDVSGVALLVQWLPLVQIGDVKTGAMADGLKDVHRLMLKTKEIVDPKFRDKLQVLTNPYLTEIHFPNPMPRDEKHELELARERLDLGLSTRQAELEKLGLGKKAVTDLMNEIEAEAKKDMELDFDFSGASAGPSPRANSEGSAGRAADNAGV